MKNSRLQVHSNFITKFWIGFIEMLLKIHALYLYYCDNLTEFSEKIERSEQKLIQKARNLRLNGN